LKSNRIRFTLRPVFGMMGLSTREKPDQSWHYPFPQRLMRRLKKRNSAYSGC